jgi:hypothetical protein
LRKAKSLLSGVISNSIKKNNNKVKQNEFNAQ